MRLAPFRRTATASRRRYLAACVAGALAVASCGGDATSQAAPSEPTAASPTTAPPAPVVQAISGNQVDFGDALTQDTVLWFWAPW